MLAAFVRLHRQNQIYAGRRLVNWCVRCHTALSDIEVEYAERKGKLWRIRYPVEGSAGGEVIVAATRPEDQRAERTEVVRERAPAPDGVHGVMPFVALPWAIAAGAWVEVVRRIQRNLDPVTFRDVIRVPLRVDGLGGGLAGPEPEHGYT